MKSVAELLREFRDSHDVDFTASYTAYQYGNENTALVTCYHQDGNDMVDGFAIIMGWTVNRTYPNESQCLTVTRS